MKTVRLEPAAPRSRVEHSTTEPLRSLSAGSDLGLHCFTHAYLMLPVQILKGIICLIFNKVYGIQDSHTKDKLLQ